MLRVYTVQCTLNKILSQCIKISSVCIQRVFPRNETYLKTKYSINVKGVQCTLYIVQNIFTSHHNLSKSSVTQKSC